MVLAQGTERHERLRRRVLALRVSVSGPVDSTRVYRDLLGLLREAIPDDGASLLTVQPASLMFVGGVVDELPAESCHPFFALEVGSTNARSFVSLARSGSVSTWSTSAEEPESAPFAEAYLRPWGYVDELRAVFMAGGHCWGVTSKARREGLGPFTAEEMATLGMIAGAVGEVLRSVVLADSFRTQPDGSGSGFVIIDENGALEASDQAQRWLGEIGQGGRDDTGTYRALEYIRAVSAHDPDRPIVVRADDGTLLSAHPQRLDGTGRLAVVLTPAAPPQIVRSVLAAHGLTTRELEVCLLVCRGQSDIEIARDLGLSVLTAQGYVKSVRVKLGVPSRAAIAGRLFADHYLDGFLATVQARHSSL